MKKIIAAALALALLLALTACELSEPAPEAPEESAPAADREPPENAPDPAPERPTGRDTGVLGTGTFEVVLEDLGRIRVTVHSAKLYDSLKEAGIDFASWDAVSGSYYDHYLKVSLTVENIDVPPDREVVLWAGDFVLALFSTEGGLSIAHPDWFDRAWELDPEEYAYDAYALPPQGEPYDMTLGYGVTDWTLEQFGKCDSVWIMDAMSGNALRITGEWEE